jgi:YegS/Rv2252/BmrU family lipid kinase
MSSTNNQDHRILFLVNPVSGGKRKEKLITKLKSLIQSEGVSAQVYLTSSRTDTIEKAAQAVRENLHTVVAVGGDGTINDVASQLVGTQIALGIIPMGSGNGLSRELKIPFDLEKAFKMILRNRIKIIDTGMVNDKPFFNIAGIGFDAHIAGQFEQAQSRGLMGYLKLILQSYSSYVPEKYTIKIGEQSLSQSAFVLAVCNGRQFGNNAWIGPNAKLDDGQLDITLIKTARWYQLPGIVWWMFLQKIDRSAQVDTFRNVEIRIKRKKEGLVNIDGEPIQMPQILNFTLISKSLKVIC